MSRLNAQKCCTCKQELFLDSFGKCKSQRLGRARVCKECRKKEYAINPEPTKQRTRSWKQKNLDKKRNSNKIWQQNHKEYFASWAANRRAKKLNATPLWLTEDDFWMIEEIYSLAKLRSDVTGIDWHVDHVIPLQGEFVSGLHVPDNLQVIPGIENQRKSNKWVQD